MICSATGIIDGASLRIPCSRTTARYARVADRRLKRIKINFQILLKFIFPFFCYCKQHWNVTANQMILLICMGEWETFVMFSIMACIFYTYLEYFGSQFQFFLPVNFFMLCSTFTRNARTRRLKFILYHCRLKLKWLFQFLSKKAL